MPLQIHLEQYDGPLDLLLDLIRRQQIEIKDIPIATITSQYQEYLDKAREMDIDLGAEFVELEELGIGGKVPSQGGPNI